MIFELSADWNRSIKAGSFLSISCNIASCLCYHVSTHSTIRTDATATATYVTGATIFKKWKDKNPPGVPMLFLTMTQQFGELSILCQSGPAETKPPRKGGRGKSGTLQHIWCMKSWDLLCRRINFTPPLLFFSSQKNWCCCILITIFISQCAFFVISVRLVLCYNLEPVTACDWESKFKSPVLVWIELAIITIIYFLELHWKLIPPISCVLHARLYVSACALLERTSLQPWLHDNIINLYASDSPPLRGESSQRTADRPSPPKSANSEAEYIPIPVRTPNYRPNLRRLRVKKEDVQVPITL